MNSTTDISATTSRDSDALGVEAGDITYAALLERHAAAETITDEMIRTAGLRLDAGTGAASEVPDANQSAALRIARLLRMAR